MKIKQSDAIVNLNIKFGADETKILDLLNYAKANGLKANGICFHVGSQVLSTKSYERAFSLARGLIDRLKASGLDIKYMDIGGGLPVACSDKDVDAEKIMKSINDCLADFEDVEVWAEPGRYICGNAVNVITSIIGKQMRDEKQWYYIDDGIYGSFSGILFDHWDYDIISLKDEDNTYEKATIAGPSCDSLDIVKKEMYCPKLDEGDLLIALNAGAYSKVSATTFNGFSLPKNSGIRIVFLRGGNTINKASIANLLVIVLVLCGIFFTMSPESQEGYSSFMEIMLGLVGVFVVVTVVRMIVVNKRNK